MRSRLSESLLFHGGPCCHLNGPESGECVSDKARTAVNVLATLLCFLLLFVGVSIYDREASRRAVDASPLFRSDSQDVLNLFDDINPDDFRSGWRSMSDEAFLIVEVGWPVLKGRRLWDEFRSPERGRRMAASVIYHGILEQAIEKLQPEVAEDHNDYFSDLTRTSIRVGSEPSRRVTKRTTSIRTKNGQSLIRPTSVCHVIG